MSDVIPSEHSESRDDTIVVTVLLIKADNHNSNLPNLTKNRPGHPGRFPYVSRTDP